MLKHNPIQKTSIWVFALPILLAVSSIACSLSGLTGDETTADTDPFITRTPLPTFTPTAEGAAFVQVTPDSPTPPPTNTPTPDPTQPPAESQPVTDEPQQPAQPTDTPTPEGPLSITLVTDMNVRGGPGTNYPVVGPGPAGESSAVVGRNSDSSWLQVEYPSDDGTGWVYAELVQINGNPDSAPVVQSPPPPAVQAPPPAEEQAPAPPPAPSYQFTPGAWHASENAGICHFKGRIKDEGGNLVNGYSVYVSNGSWGTVSHPSGPGGWYPDKGPGEWDVSGIQLNQCPGWWKLSVVKYECNYAAGFDAQCKDFATLSEVKDVHVVYPDEMVINADWVCHWDCNKGVYQ